MVSVNIITIVIVNVTYLVVGITCPLIIIIGRLPTEAKKAANAMVRVWRSTALCSEYCCTVQLLCAVNLNDVKMIRIIITIIIIVQRAVPFNIVALCSCAGWILNILSLELQCCSHYKYAHCTHLNISPKYCIVQCAELCDRSGDSARTELIAAVRNRGWISRPVGQWLGQRTLQHQRTVQQVHCPNTQYQQGNIMYLGNTHCSK